MIFRRLLLATTGASVLAAAAAVAVFAVAFCLYALAEPYVGRAGAAAVVAGLTAVLMALGGFLLAMAGRRRPAPKPAPLTGNLLEQAIAFVRQKPVTTAAAAIGAGLLAVRNPKYLGQVLRSFFEDATN